MSKLWHIARKDFRELKGTVILYSLFIAAKLLVGALLVRNAAVDPVMFSRMEAYGNLFIGLEVLTGYVVVAAFVHENPLIGTKAEWMTRPISGGQLFVAKMLGIGFVLVVVPLLLSLPWWLGSGFGANEIERAVAETLLRQAAVLVPALALAVLTDGFDRYVIWLLFLFGLGFCVSKLPPIRAAVLTGPVAETREWLTLGVAAVTAALVVLNQFFTRRTGRGVTLLCLGLGGMALAAWWWPYSLECFRPVEEAAAPEHLPADEITLALERARVVKVADGPSELRVNVAVRGVPPELKLRSGTAAQTWSWPGVQIERPGELSEDTYGTIAPALRALGLTVPRMDPAWFQTNAERPVRVGLLGQPIFPEGVGLNVRTELSGAYLARMRREAPGYDLVAGLELFRPEVIGEAALQTEGRLDRGQDRLRIAHLAQVGNALRVTLVEYGPGVSWKSPGRYVGCGFTEPGPPVEYFLVNRKRGNASHGQELGVQQARFGTVAITWRTLQFSAPREWIAGAWVELPGWFQGLSLAKIVNRRVSEVQRTLHVTELPVTEEK